MLGRLLYPSLPVPVTCILHRKYGEISPKGMHTAIYHERGFNSSLCKEFCFKLGYICMLPLTTDSCQCLYKLYIHCMPSLNTHYLYFHHPSAMFTLLMQMHGHELSGLVYKLYASSNPQIIQHKDSQSPLRLVRHGSDA